MSEGNNVPLDPNKFIITITVTRQPTGDSVFIDAQPPNMFPDYALSILRRAVDFYDRNLQTGVMFQAMERMQKDQKIIRDLGDLRR